MGDRIRFASTIFRAFAGDAIPLLGISRVPLRAGLGDIDINLHVTNSQYLRFMDLGRTDLFVRNGLARAAWELKAGPVVGGAAVRFKAEIRPGEKIEIVSRIVGWDEKWFYCEQALEVGGRARSIGVVKFLFHRSGEQRRPDEVLAAHEAGPATSPIDGPSVAAWASENGL